MNTKVLVRTINDLDSLRIELEGGGFEVKIDEGKMEVSVGYLDYEKFAEIIEKYLNAPYNYVNVKFPDKRLNILIFPKKTFIVDSKESDDVAKKWALSLGLPEDETKWTTVY